MRMQFASASLTSGAKKSASTNPGSGSLAFEDVTNTSAIDGTTTSTDMRVSLSAYPSKRRRRGVLMRSVRKSLRSCARIDIELATVGPLLCAEGESVTRMPALPLTQRVSEASKCARLDAKPAAAYAVAARSTSLVMKITAPTRDTAI